MVEEVEGLGQLTKLAGLRPLGRLTQFTGLPGGLTSSGGARPLHAPLAGQAGAMAPLAD